MMRHFLGLYVFAFIFLAPSLHAAEITKVKGKSVLIDLKGDAASPGDVFYAVKSNGKRSALIQISKVKGEKAIGKVSKGKAAVGEALELKGAGVVKSSPRSNGGSSVVSPTGRSYWGAIAGYAMDSMNVSVKRSVDNADLGKADLSGSGYSIKALFDYELFPQVWFRGLSGIEMFNVTGPAKCGDLNGQTCDAKIMYWSFDFIGRYVFSNGNIRPWAGAGLGLLLPISKSATALQANSIATTNVVMVTGGVDWFVTPNLYIPVSIEYGFLPKSDEVEANLIALRIGLAVPF
jgi:hypothetical protein